MKVLKARIKQHSKHYEKGLNPKGKSIWLQITGFNPEGELNYRLRAVKGIVNGFAQFEEIWLPHSDIQIKEHDDGQLSLLDVE